MPYIFITARLDELLILVIVQNPITPLNNIVETKVTMLFILNNGYVYVCLLLCIIVIIFLE